MLKSAAYLLPLLSLWAAAAVAQDSHDDLLNQHYAPHYRATLGLVVGPVTGPLAAHVPIFQGRPGYGLVVHHVAPDSPAARAGIRRDDILIAFGNQRLYSTKQYGEILGRVRPGQEVKVQVVHPGNNGAVSTIQVTMGWAEQLDSSASVPASFNALGTPANSPSTPAAANQTYGGAGDSYVFPPARTWAPTSGYPDDPRRDEPQDYNSVEEEQVGQEP